MMGTLKKFNDQTTQYEHRKKPKNESHSHDLQETFLWFKFVCFNVTICYYF